ncbi:MAG: NlpC/P60 family protein [Pseudomonadota bacterium]
MSGQAGFGLHALVRHDRAQVVACANAWLGTPYHHQASRRGAGTDCLGLVRGVYRDLYGREAAKPPPYTRDWAEALGKETLLKAAAVHLQSVSRSMPLPGDVVAFRWRPDAPAKHLGIMTEPHRFVHALEGVGVCTVTLMPWWRRRLAGVFQFPGTLD